MDGNAQAQYFPPQDSLAVEMLNKLQDASGFTTVSVSEVYALQPSNPSLVSCSTPVLNASLVPSSHSQTSVSSDGTIFNAATGFDPALTQLLVAAQAGSPAVIHTSVPNSISGVSPMLTSSLSGSFPSHNAQTLHPVLSTTLSLAPQSNQIINAPILISHDSAPPEHIPVSNSDAMTITVQCTMSDTVIVVGQQNWQCCMCRNIHGFDISIDQHLMLKHNLCMLHPGHQESGIIQNQNTVKGKISLPNMNTFANSGGVSAPPLQTISEQALALLKTPGLSNSNNRSGLEREVALLMAQTFTHSGSESIVKEEADRSIDSSSIYVNQSKPNDSFPTLDHTLSNSAELNNGQELCISTRDNEARMVSVFGKMIRKVERAILSTLDSNTKNDLLLVATELARMRKDATSKRNKMKKSHRYISCSKCGKEVRNRKDLIKQHNRCHEKAKKFRCLICNKMFKYIHTLRRHVFQQGHTGGMPAEMALVGSADADTDEDPNVANDTGQVKSKISEVCNNNADLIKVRIPSLSPETSDSRTENSDNKTDNEFSIGEPAYEKILAMLLSKGEQNRTTTGRKLSLLQCFVCDHEIRNRNYYITRHARCHIEDLCYRCSVCGQEFYRSDYYKDHILQHGDSSSQRATAYTLLSDSSSSAKSLTVQEKTVSSAQSRRKVLISKPATVPCKICDKEIFNRTYNIKRHAQQHSILEWESILGSSQDSSLHKSQNKPVTCLQHCIRCGVCGMIFKSYTQKRCHMLKHRSNFFCRICSCKMSNVAELVVHSQSCRKNNDTTVGEQAQQIDSQSSQDPLQRKHLSEQVLGVKKFTCPVCHARIIHTTQNISRHMRELHSDGKPHSCSTCSRTYDSYHKLQRHLKSHGDTGGICHICGKVFQTKAALRSHTKLHATPEGMFQCPHCPKSFRFQGRLEKHIRKHAEHADVCPHCGKIYISKIHLRRHISVVHLGVKDYRHKCDQCGAQFFESVQLRDHIAYRHQGIQLYQCKYCNKGFNCRPTMIRHERKEHTNYLPYKCKHCCQCFPEKSKLVAHEMTHTGMSPHKCDICNKYFTTGSALKAHKNLHLGVKPFVCTVCGKNYLKNWHLQQHIRKAHQQQTIEVMVYDIPSPNPAGQEVVQQQPVSQHGKLDIMPTVGQPCLQTADVKFLNSPAQGEYLHVQTAKSNELHSETQNMIQSQNQTVVQHDVVYQ